MSTPSLDSITRALIDDPVVPVLGAGVNLCGRPEKEPWQQGRFLPSGYELANYLAKKCGYPEDEVIDLLRVSQYVSVMQGSGPLYKKLRSLFDADYSPTSLHQFLATLPVELRKKGYKPQPRLIVTTNYDDVLEKALHSAGEPFDLVSYIADGDHRGKFLHRPPDAEPQVIEIPNQYDNLRPDRRTVVLKIHGEIDRLNAARDSYMITEDHYIEFLTRTEVATLLPVHIAAHLRQCHFLFLGYGLRDWNLRVILHRIWGQQKLTYQSWAIQLTPDDMDCKFWNQNGVEIINIPLEDFVSEIAKRIEVFPTAQP